MTQTPMKLADPLTVACRWCFAPVGERCVGANGTRRHKPHHHVRIVEAAHGAAATAVIEKILRDQEAREMAEQRKRNEQKEIE